MEVPGARPAAHRIWTSLCLAGLLALLASRLLYYSPVPLPDFALSLLQRLMLFETLNAVVGLLLAFPVVPIVALGLAFLTLVRRRWVFVREGRVRHLRPWVSVLLWTCVLLYNGFYDSNPHVALGAWLGMPLLVPAVQRRLRPADPRLRRLAPWLVWLGLIAACALLARDAADAIALALWLGLLFRLARPPVRLGRPERLLLALLLLPFVQAFAGWLPLPTELHGGTWLGESMAYSYCESPKRDRLYVSVPNCGTHWPSIAQCKDGYVAEFDATDLTPIAQHRVLDDRFHGRIEQLVCLEDTIQIGMNRTVFEGERQLEDAMEISMDDPTQVRPHLLGEEGGHRVHYDPARNALLYVGDDVLRLHRVDRETGRIERIEGEGAAAERIANSDVHLGRDRLYGVAFDAPVREIDLETLEVRRRWSHAAATELSVDEAADRLYVTGFWGLEVFDLETGRLLLRRRLGMIGRKPLIDEARGLVYVPTMGEGKIHVFDRATFRALGAIPIGIGSRYPHLSRDGKRFFAGSYRGYYHFDAEALARRMRGGSAPR